jgi:hypothetical protein
MGPILGIDNISSTPENMKVLSKKASAFILFGSEFARKNPERILAFNKIVKTSVENVPRRIIVVVMICRDDNAKPPFAGPKQVINYLGNYTHQIAISNHRLVKIENDYIHFRYRDSAHGNKHKTMSLPAREFMRRFLLHVLPSRFVRMRHYGFLGNRFRKIKIARLQKILIPEAPTESAVIAEKKDWKAQIKQLTGVDITVCPKCGRGRMIEIRVIKSFYNRCRSYNRKAWDTS